MKVVVTFGTFDVFHIGHVNILERAKELGTKLIVGVSTDELNFSKKSRYPIYNEKSRVQILSALHCVDEVFLEESLEMKRDYLLAMKADVLVMGDDWKGKFDEFSDICEVVYLPRTKDISTTEIIKMVRLGAEDE
jgi:glycerol-3-phosphate cytidylyltransferase